MLARSSTTSRYVPLLLVSVSTCCRRLEATLLLLSSPADRLGVSFEPPSCFEGWLLGLGS